MAEYRDEYGNRIPMVDEHGNPISRVDEFGNPIRGDPVGTGGYGTAAERAAAEAEAEADHGGHETKERHGILHRSGSSSSSSSSSEDDGQGGRRRKKKGLKDKIKEKLPRGHKSGDEHHKPTGGEHGVGSTPPTTSGATTEAHHEKKGIMEKIKEKLPGHH